MSQITLAKPFSGFWPITQKFGAIYQYKGKSVKHYGVDFACPKGTEIFAPIDGVVFRIEKYRSYGYGKTVYIRGKNGEVEVLLAHLSKINCEVNDVVRRGETVVGLSGRTGFWRGKTGYHLHFGFKLRGEDRDPLEFLPSYNEQLKEEIESQKVDVKDENDRYYKIKKGDTLWAISEKMLGDPNKWTKIYKANKKIIGKNPDLIYPGTRIRIPK